MPAPKIARNRVCVRRGFFAFYHLPHRGQSVSAHDESPLTTGAIFVFVRDSRRAASMTPDKNRMLCAVILSASPTLPRPALHGISSPTLHEAGAAVAPVLSEGFAIGKWDAPRQRNNQLKCTKIQILMRGSSRPHRRTAAILNL